MTRSIAASDIRCPHRNELILEHHMPLVPPEHSPGTIGSRKMGSGWADPLDQHTRCELTGAWVDVLEILIIRHHEIAWLKHRRPSLSLRLQCSGNCGSSIFPYESSIPRHPWVCTVYQMPSSRPHSSTSSSFTSCRHWQTLQGESCRHS